MKYITLLCLSFLYISITAQTAFDDIVWPPNYVTITECGNFVGDTPYFVDEEKQQNLFVNIDMIELYDNDGNCDKLSTTFTLLDWASGQTLDSVYIARVNPEYSVDALSIFEYDEGTSSTHSIQASDLIVNPQANTHYTFSSTDSTAVNVSIEDGTSKTVRVYNYTDNIWYSQTNVVPTICQAGYEFTFFPSRSIDIDNHFQNWISGDLYDDGSFFNCSPFTVSLSFDGEEYHEEINVDITLDEGTHPIFIKFETETGYAQVFNSELVITKSIELIFTKFIELKNIVEGEEVEIIVWSDGVDNLLAFQFELLVKDATVLDIMELHPDLEVVSFHQSEDAFRALWDSPTLEPLNLSFDQEWYKIKVMPHITGTTEDIFSWENENQSFVIGDDQYCVELGYTFDYMFASRNVLNSSESPAHDIVKAYPNPTSSTFTVELHDECSVKILNLQGQVVKSIQGKKGVNNIDVAQLSCGTYLLYIANENVKNTVLKFQKS